MQEAGRMSVRQKSYDEMINESNLIISISNINFREHKKNRSKSSVWKRPLEKRWPTLRSLHFIYQVFHGSIRSWTKANYEIASLSFFFLGKRHPLARGGRRPKPSRGIPALESNFPKKIFSVHVRSTVHIWKK